MFTEILRVKGILILEKQFKGGDGTYEVIGYESPFLINQTDNRDEYADGGALF